MAPTSFIDLGRTVEPPVALLGYGRSGAATARALTRAGIALRVWDDDPGRRDAALRDGLSVADFEQTDLAGFGTLVLSPGIPHSGPRAHKVATRARARGLEILCDIELLYRAQPDAIYVGVTGTNGKSTTTALLGHILAQNGRPFAIGGNIGTPVLDLAPLGRDGIYLLEVSSYQLDLLSRAAFHVAILLNITQDHLDHHGGMANYVAAKRRIFARQGVHDTAIVGVDTEAARAIYCDLATEGRQSVLPISGQGPDRAKGGIHADGSQLIDARAGLDKVVADLAELTALPGAHNAENAAAAYAAATALELIPDRIAAALASFAGLPHRQELVATIDGVAYVNDSKATNEAAAARALACYENIYWIAGGRAKQGAHNLAAPIEHAARVRHAYLIGEAREDFGRALAAHMATTACDSLEEAVDLAAQEAAHDISRNEISRNDVREAVVLLSPACASFDQFADFEARGDAFRTAVAQLTAAPRLRSNGGRV